MLKWPFGKVKWPPTFGDKKVTLKHLALAYHINAGALLQQNLTLYFQLLYQFLTEKTVQMIWNRRQNWVYMKEREAGSIMKILSRQLINISHQKRGKRKNHHLQECLVKGGYVIVPRRLYNSRTWWTRIWKKHLALCYKNYGKIAWNTVDGRNPAPVDR